MLKHEMSQHRILTLFFSFQILVSYSLLSPSFSRWTKIRYPKLHLCSQSAHFLNIVLGLCLNQDFFFSKLPTVITITVGITGTFV